MIQLTTNSKMELALEPDMYSPSVDETGKYIDVVGNIFAFHADSPGSIPGRVSFLSIW